MQDFSYLIVRANCLVISLARFVHFFGPKDTPKMLGCPQSFILINLRESLLVNPKIHNPKIPLTIFSISSILHSSFLAVSNNPSLNFWRIYEMGFPEDADAIGFRGILKSFGAFFSWTLILV
jgi:hypothetical protein